MAIENNLILLSGLRLIVGLFIGKENLRLYDTLDWQQASDRFSAVNFTYPEYYTSQNFHGIQGGYLNPIAPVTYDAVTRFAAPPNETKLRQQVITTIKRLLKPGGQIIIVDGNQKRLRHTNWLIKLFREPYSQVYTAESVDTWLQDLGLKQVQTKYVGWISQITSGFKINL